MAIPSAWESWPDVRLAQMYAERAEAVRWYAAEGDERGAAQADGEARECYRVLQTRGRERLAAEAVAAREEARRRGFVGEDAG